MMPTVCIQIAQTVFLAEVHFYYAVIFKDFFHQHVLKYFHSDQKTTAMNR